DIEAVLLEELRSRLRARYCAPNAQFARGQPFYEPLHGRAGADADDVVVVHVRERGFGGVLLLSIDVHARSPQRESAANTYFSSFGNDCARLRGHSLHHHHPEELLLLLGSLLLAAFLLGRFLCLSCHSNRSPCRVSPGAVYT